MAQPLAIGTPFSVRYLSLDIAEIKRWTIVVLPLGVSYLLAVGVSNRARFAERQVAHVREPPER